MTENEKPHITSMSYLEDLFVSKHGPHAYATWISILHPVMKSPAEIEVQAPTRFVRDWVSKHYFKDLEGFLSSVMGVPDITITTVCNKHLKAPIRARSTDEVMDDILSRAE